MLGNGNGKQRLVEDWSEDEATFVSVPGRQSGHTKVDIVKVSLMLFCETDKILCLYNISMSFNDQDPGRCCGRCSTAARMSGLGVAAWGVAAAAQCQTRGCPGSRGPQGGCGGRGGDGHTSRSDIDSE